MIVNSPPFSSAVENKYSDIIQQRQRNDVAFFVPRVLVLFMKQHITSSDVGNGCSHQSFIIIDGIRIFTAEFGVSLENVWMIVKYSQTIIDNIFITVFITNNTVCQSVVPVKSISSNANFCVLHPKVIDK